MNKKREVVIPKLRTEKNSANGWDKFMSWDDVDKVVVLQEYFGDISSDLSLVVNKILHGISDDLFQYKKITDW